MRSRPDPPPVDRHDGASEAILAKGAVSGELIGEPSAEVKVKLAGSGFGLFTPSYRCRPRPEPWRGRSEPAHGHAHMAGRRSHRIADRSPRFRRSGRPRALIAIDRFERRIASGQTVVLFSVSWTGCRGQASSSSAPGPCENGHPHMVRRQAPNTMKKAGARRSTPSRRPASAIAWRNQTADTAATRPHKTSRQEVGSSGVFMPASPLPDREYFEAASLSSCSQNPPVWNGSTTSNPERY